jgi:excisionase family DNA binding protein
MTVAEVAARCAVSVKTIRRRISNGVLPVHRLGKRTLRVDAEVVTRLLAARTGAVESVARVENETKPSAVESQEGGEVRFKVNHEPGRGFIIRYYAADGKRKGHRISVDRIPDDTPIEIAEAYAAEWVRQNVAPSPKRARRQVAHSGTTFKQHATEWFDGTLNKRYPDHVKRKVSAKDDAARLKRYVFPHIGDEPMAAFEGPHGVDLVERVIAALPDDLTPGSRRQIIQAMHRVVALAVYPCRLLAANPLPPGFVPNRSVTRAKSYLRPHEEAKLLACESIPLQLRFCFGMLCREGLRVSEALNLEWRHLDLEIGVIRLDRNKTDEPRVWALSPDVAESLRRWKKLLGRKATPTRAVLLDAAGNKIDRYEAARELRARLLEAGVDRAELFEQTRERIAFRAHDLRGTFVTIKLALGKSEAWITDRTGHTTSAMIYRYKRAARSAAELQLGDFAPMHEVIPELRKLGSTSGGVGSNA